MKENLVVDSMPIAWETINELLDHRGRHDSEKVVMDVCGVRLTYGELIRQTRIVADNLFERGVRKGDRVASFMNNRIEQVLGWFGTVRIGAVWVPINAGLLGNDLQHTLNDAAPKVVIAEDELCARIDAVSGWEGMKIVAGRAQVGFTPFSDLLIATQPAPTVAVGPADSAVIMYTGGTTGMPKGAVLPHFAFIAAGYRYIQTYEIRPDDRHFSVLSLFHNAGLMLGIIGPIVANITTTIEPRFSVRSYWQRIRETRSTVLDMVGTIMVLLNQTPPGPDDRNHTARISLSPIAQVPQGTLETFKARFGIAMVNLYSLSEGGGIVIIRSTPDSDKPYSNGHGWGWADVAILDDDDMPLPPGKTGEICLRPKLPHIFMSGYHNNTKKTLETFRNFWLHTGDLGHLDDDGWLYFTGRQVHWMRRRGENISAYEIESVVSQMPGVRESIAVGVPSALGDEEVKVFIIAADAADVKPKDVVAWCATQLAGFKVPRFVEMVSEFPRSATKMEVERHKLRSAPNDRAWDRENPA